MSNKWETFRDDSYYHMWRLRRKNERKWDDGFHINSKEDAEVLCELLNKLEGEIENLKASGIHTCHNQCQRPMCVMRRERDELREQRDRLEEFLNDLWPHYSLTRELGRQLKRELTEAREQRDRLAEALRRIREGWDGTKAEPDCDCEDCEYLRTIDEALAAVKGGSDE